jgi:chaperonin GroEL
VVKVESACSQFFYGNNIQDDIGPITRDRHASHDESTSPSIPERPNQIVGNAGEEGAVVVGRIRDSKDNNFGYNAQTGEFEDLIKAGVVDPTKVTRTALQNAASIASLMLTTEALVSEVPEEKKAPAMPGGHGGMGDMY